MTEELFIPKLGQTVEEVIIVSWLVEDGVRVEFGQPVLEVETDKAVFPIEANANGFLHLGPYKVGDVLPVLSVVATIGGADERFEVKGAPAQVESESKVPESDGGATARLEGAQVPVPPQEKIFISPRARRLVREKGVEDISKISPTGGEGTRITERDVQAYLHSLPKATPVAQKIASEAGLDLRAMSGTGTRGTITKADVEQVLREKFSAVPPSAAPQPLVDMEVHKRIPLKGVPGLIFERMAASVHTTARVTLITEADATAFVEARESLKKSVTEAWGFAPGYNDLLAIIVARALREYPYMNARLSEDGSSIEWVSSINLGMAVDTERGLLVPVIREADRKGLQAFGSEFRQLVERARAGRSLPDDLTGGTFTITNLGMYEVDAFTPIINLPEAAILGVGRITPKVVPFEEEIVVRQRWALSLVFDHRLVDGAPAARFLQRIKHLVENPFLLLG
ncbi:MAG: 2-oxo acid dehydrogenase subunit E2 [Anaerolineales bacterium]